MSNLSESGLDIVGEFIHKSDGKVDSDRFTVTRKENDEEAFSCDVCDVGFNSQKGVKRAFKGREKGMQKEK